MVEKMIVACESCKKREKKRQHNKAALYALAVVLGIFAWCHDDERLFYGEAGVRVRDLYEPGAYCVRE